MAIGFFGNHNTSHPFANTFQGHINSTGTLEALEQELRQFGRGFVDDAVTALMPVHGIFVGLKRNKKGGRKSSPKAESTEGLCT